MRPESIRVHRSLAIPLGEIELRTSRSSGPGGQHAQKTETRVEALFDVEASTTLREEQKRRLLARVEGAQAGRQADPRANQASSQAA
jgi:ribosome-associated protein